MYYDQIRHVCEPENTGDLVKLTSYEVDVFTGVISPPVGKALRPFSYPFEFIEDLRGRAVFLKEDCTKSFVVSVVGPIDDQWTLKKPTTQWDEWVDNMWVTNLRSKYIAKYDQVDSARRAAYREVSDPLYMEAWRKESKGLVDEAAAFRQQADAAVELIQSEHPWPTPPEV